MSWPSVANERRGTVAVFERALTEFHSVKLPRAANESRWRIGLIEYVITESVCPPGVPRHCAAARALSFAIDDSARGESNSCTRSCECGAFDAGGVRDAKQSSSAMTRILSAACRSV